MARGGAGKTPTPLRFESGQNSLTLKQKGTEMNTKIAAALKALRQVPAAQRGAHWQIASRHAKFAKLLADRNAEAAADHLRTAEFSLQFVRAT